MLRGPTLTVTLTTGTCAIVKNGDNQNGTMYDKDDLLDSTLTCTGPELSYEKVVCTSIFLYPACIADWLCDSICLSVSLYVCLFCCTTDSSSVSCSCKR